MRETHWGGERPSTKPWRWPRFLIALAGACAGTRSASPDAVVQTLDPGIAADVDSTQCARDVTPEWPGSWRLERVNPAEDCVEYLPKTKSQGVTFFRLALCPKWFSLKDIKRAARKTQVVELGDRSIECRVDRRSRGIALECSVQFHSDRVTPVFWAEWRGRDVAFANQLLRFLAQVPLGPADYRGNGLWICGVCAIGDKSFLKSREDIRNDVLLGG